MRHTPARVILVARGTPRYALQVLPPQDAEALLEPLEELAVHLERCQGCPPPWYRRETPDAQPVRLVLALSPGRSLDREAFEIAAAPRRVTLTAATVTGLTHAVHYFLEAAFGVRWLWPGELGTVTPRARTVAWPLGVRRHAPDWAWRRLWLGGAFWGEQDPALAELARAGVSPATLEAARRWQRRNRLGGLRLADGHRWSQICPPERYGRRHPDYFALVNGRRDTRPVNGKHRNQPCTSHPAVVRRTANYVLAQFKARPELDGFSISVNDGNGFCECPRCRALDEPDSAPAAADGFERATREDSAPASGPAQGRSIAARLFHFANHVAARVARVYPDKRLLLLIYSAYRRPPRTVRLHPAVIAQFCVMSWAHTDAAVRRADLKLVAGLRPVAGRRAIYDYFVNGANGSLPRGFARVFSRSLDAYYRAGCRGFATQAGLDFALNGFAYTLAARRLWDMRLTVGDVLRDYGRSGFGRGAPAVRHYLLAFMRRWESGVARGGDLEEYAGAVYPAAWRAARRRELARAEAACAGGGPCPPGSDRAAPARVRFLRDGLEFLDRYVTALDACAELKRRGAPAHKPVDGTALRAWVRAGAARRAVAHAVAARRRLFDWAATHADGYWFAALWFRYQYQSRSGLLGEWMDTVEAAAGTAHARADRARRRPTGTLGLPNRLKRPDRDVGGRGANAALLPGNDGRTPGTASVPARKSRKCHHNPVASGGANAAQL